MQGFGLSARAMVLGNVQCRPEGKDRLYLKPVQDRGSTRVIRSVWRSPNQLVDQDRKHINNDKILR